jgi:hypothetical protein
MADDEEGLDGDGQPRTPEDFVTQGLYKKGASFLLDGRKRGDGNVVQMSEAQLGVLQKLVTASRDDKDWRQALLLTRFKNNRERQRAVSLIGWMLRHDVPLTLVVADWLARCAEGGGAREDAIQALTHMTLTTTNKSWDKRDGRNPRSPIH